MTVMLWMFAIWLLGTQLIPDDRLRNVWFFLPLVIAGLLIIGAGWCQWKIAALISSCFGFEQETL
jgi:hypothetical protein